MATVAYGRDSIWLTVRCIVVTAFSIMYIPRLTEKELNPVAAIKPAVNITLAVKGIRTKLEIKKYKETSPNAGIAINEVPS